MPVAVAFHQGLGSQCQLRNGVAAVASGAKAHHSMMCAANSSSSSRHSRASRVQPATLCVTAAAAQEGSAWRRPHTTARAAAGRPGAPAVGGVDPREAHKVFDEAVIIVKSGDGGHGEIVEAGRGKFVRNHKYHAGGNQPKQIWLPASAPADGADGGDVVLVCDASLDTLLHLHQRHALWAARRGGQGNPAAGSAGPKRNQDRKKGSTPPLEIRVPAGTVVKRKSSGAVLGELLQPGQRLVVAVGGKGGRGAVAPSRLQKHKELAEEQERAAASGAEVVAVEDVNWRADTKGGPGQQLSLTLLLRVVADVGLVGFPNAGKSSLLAALTRASPEVAPYPFTTLMPNLGVMAAGSAWEGSSSGGGSRSSSGGGGGQQAAPVLADLPGLIEGAHLGKGLGRMFLRHLRRTRLLLHVVDASAPDPATDYMAVREELRMYNPEYVARPHVVALNKCDLEDAGGLQEEIADEVMAVARSLQQQHAQDVPSGISLPAAIVPCSAVTGESVQQLAAALQAVLQSGGSHTQPPLQQQLESPPEPPHAAAPAAAAAAAAAPPPAPVPSPAAAAPAATTGDGAGSAAGPPSLDAELAVTAHVSELQAKAPQERVADAKASDATSWEPAEPGQEVTDEDLALANMSEEELLRLADETEGRVADDWSLLV